MAGANAYAGGFIGNDLVLPKRQPKQPTVEVEEPQLLKIETTAQARPFAQPIIKPKSRISRLFSLRTAGLFVAMLLSSYLLLSTIAVVNHSNALASLSSATASLQQRVSDNLHHQPAYVSLPAYSVAVENSHLKNDISNIKEQSVVINFSFASTSPSSAQLSGWITTSAGPKAGTTLLSVNTVAVTKYLTSMVRLYDQSSSNEVIANLANGTSQVISNGSNGITYSGVSKASKQLVTQLLTANGVNVSLVGTIVPYKTIVTNKP